MIRKYEEKIDEKLSKIQNYGLFTFFKVLFLIDYIFYVMYL